MKLLRPIGFALVSWMTIFAHAASANEWAIEVNVYRIFPGDEFKALSELGSLIAKETSNGFLTKTVVTRAGFHEGATFCLLTNRNLGDPQFQRDRILIEIDTLREYRQFSEFTVTTPSTCADND